MLKPASWRNSPWRNPLSWLKPKTFTLGFLTSYSRKDKPFVQQLHQSLEAEGRDAWVDWEGIPLTADWWAEIQAGIEAADTFVFIISPNSAASQVCGQEIDHAVEHNKRIVPIVYHDVRPKDLPETLTHLNWIFCRESDDFDSAFKGLMVFITRTLSTQTAEVSKTSAVSAGQGDVITKTACWVSSAQYESWSVRIKTIGAIFWSTACSRLSNVPSL